MLKRSAINIYTRLCNSMDQNFVYCWNKPFDSPPIFLKDTAVCHSCKMSRFTEFIFIAVSDCLSFVCEKAPTQVFVTLCIKGQCSRSHAALSARPGWRPVQFVHISAHMSLTAGSHSIPLSDGNRIPLLGLGTYGDPRTVRRLVFLHLDMNSDC